MTPKEVIKAYKESWEKRHHRKMQYFPISQREIEEYKKENGMRPTPKDSVIQDKWMKEKYWAIIADRRI